MVRGRRAWVPALVAGFTTILVAGVSLGLWDLLMEKKSSWINDDNGLAAFVYSRLAPFGGDISTGDVRAESVIQVVIGIGLAALVALVLAWLSARGLVQGSSGLPVFVGTWFGVVLGSALGALAAFEYRLAEVNVETGDGVWLIRGDVVESGAYWGLAFGWLVALVTALFWRMVRGRPAAADRFDDADGDDTPGPIWQSSTPPTHEPTRPRP